MIRHVELDELVCPNCGGRGTIPAGVQVALCEACFGSAHRGALLALDLDADEYVADELRAARDSLASAQQDALVSVETSLGVGVIVPTRALDFLTVELVVLRGAAESLLVGAGFHRGESSDDGSLWLPGVRSEPTAARLWARGKVEHLRFGWQAIEVRKRRSVAA